MKQRAARKSAKGPARKPQAHRPAAPAASKETHGQTFPPWLLAAFIVLNLFIYAGVSDYPFASRDDALYVTANPNISAGLSWQSIAWAVTTDRAGYWMPITWLSHILDVQFFGMNAGPQHVVNVLFHILNTLLLFGFLRRATGKLWQSAFVAGLFAVHPLHVESVAWISERKDVLSTMLLFLSLWAYTAYVRRPSRRHYLLVILIFGMALTAKPSVVTLPFLLLLLDFWPLGRARLARGQGRVWFRLALEKLPLAVMAAGASLMTLAFHEAQNGLSALGAISLGTRIANAAVSYAAYIRDMLWPASLSPFYPYSTFPAWIVAASLLLLAGLTAFAMLKARTYPYILVGWLWFLGALIPMIGLVQAGMQSRADRFTYVPLIGLFIAVAWGIPQAITQWRHHARALACLAGIAICTLTLAARQQVGYWRDRPTLWQHALETTSSNFIAHNILGLAMVDLGNLDEAIRHYRQALEIYPQFASARNNLGIALAYQGKLDESETEFRSAIANGNARPEMYRNLGLALSRQGKSEEAIAQYNEALRLEPGDVEAQTNMGDELFRQGKLEEAIARYREALRIQPRLALAHNNLAVVLSSQQRYDEAIVHFQEALRIQPGMAEAHNGIGSVLANQGNHDKAIEHFLESLRIRPDFADARLNLMNARAIQGSQGAAPPPSNSLGLSD
jgi:protein O-mannosyl-transferase